MSFTLSSIPFLSRSLRSSSFSSKILSNIANSVTVEAHDVFLTSCVHNTTNRWFVLLCRVCCQLPHVYPHRTLPQSGWLETGIQLTWDAIRSRNLHIVDPAAYFVIYAFLPHCSVSHATLQLLNELRARVSRFLADFF